MNIGTATTKVVKALVTMMSAAILVTLLVPGQAEAANQNYYITSSYGPCPFYAIQDVFDDPQSDWDNDRITNVTELYNGLNPCVNDSAAYCAAYAYNCTALIAQNPCAVTSYHSYGYDYRGVYYYTPLTSWSWTHVNNNPWGDWDGDGISNHTEAKAGANPCLKPCPNPRRVDLTLNPNGDWDRDGVSNLTEVNQGSDPCNRYSYYIQQRLPHVEQPNYNQSPAPAGYKCPQGYPYYHPGTKLCYANPVGNHY